jgi:uncharacterized HAD superfamily protein
MDLGQQEFNNNAISPVLPDGLKNYLIDIDGTITDDVPNEEPWRMETCLPYQGSLDSIVEWYKEGHIITFFTSRTETNRKVTEDWLKKHGYPYHHLLMNKPRGGNYHWIDNHIVRATRYEGKWTKMTKKKLNIEVFE